MLIRRIFCYKTHSCFVHQNPILRVSTCVRNCGRHAYLKMYGMVDERNRQSMFEIAHFIGIIFILSVDTTQESVCYIFSLADEYRLVYFLLLCLCFDYFCSFYSLPPSPPYLVVYWFGTTSDECVFLFVGLFQRLLWNLSISLKMKMQQQQSEWCLPSAKLEKPSAFHRFTSVLFMRTGGFVWFVGLSFTTLTLTHTHITFNPRLYTMFNALYIFPLVHESMQWRMSVARINEPTEVLGRNRQVFPFSSFYGTNC